MRQTPDYIATQARLDNSIALLSATRDQVPTYKHVFVCEKETDFKDGELAQFSSALITQDEENSDAMYIPQCQLIETNPVDQAKLIRLSICRKNEFGGSAFRTAPYFIMPGSDCAFEISVEGIPSRDPATDKVYHDVLSLDNVNEWRKKRFDRFYKDDNSYRDEFGQMTPFERNAGEAVDWRKLNFYNIVRYNKIEYAAKKENADEYFLITTCEREPGTTDRVEIHIVDKDNACNNTVHKLPPGRRVPFHPLPDLSEIGVDTAAYQKVDLQNLNEDVFLAADSYKGGKQYINPANYTRATNEFILRLI